MAEMAQLLTTKPEDPSLISRTHVVQEEDQARTHMMEGENRFFQDVSGCATVACTQAHAHIQIKMTQLFSFYWICSFRAYL